MEKSLRTKISLICAFFVVWMLCFSFVGCKSKESGEGAVQIPQGCENSLIYKKLKNPVVIDSIMQLITLETVKHGILSVENVEIFYSSLSMFLFDENITYQDFFGILKSQLKALESVSAEMVIAANTLDSLYEPIKIDACDIKMLRIHIEHQMNLLKAMKKS